MKRGLWKKKAKQVFKLNYWRCFAVCFIVTLLAGGTILSVQYPKSFEISSFPLHQIDGKSNSQIVNEFINSVSVSNDPIPKANGIIGNVFNNVSRSGSFLFGILNALNQFLFHDQVVAGIIIIVGVVISIFYWIFISKVLEVGRCRFFLENRIYSKTRIGRVLLPFRIRKNVSIALTMFLKNIYQFLWIFTIIGGPIKYYSYRMVPYILAENPGIRGNKAIALSEEMMDGHKWEAFLLDVSFWGWEFLGFLSLNILNLFYTNGYKEATNAEYYMYLREVYKNQTANQDDYFKDIYLEENHGNSVYPEKKYLFSEHDSRKYLRMLRYERKYSLTSYILLFFAFSIFGWIWEVCITLFSEGVFVNRGTFFGPWLPIYGSGGVLILFLFQKIRNRPVLLFFLTVLLCGVIEFGTSLYLEYFHHLKWWDYTGYFLNIQGRVCLDGLLFFGIGGLAFTYVIGPYLDNLLAKWNPTFKKVLCIFLVSIFVVDYFYSSSHPNIGDRITTTIEMTEKWEGSFERLL